jgi:hypothetical protein
MKKKLISPLVDIYETDESGIDYSPLKNRPRAYSGGAPTSSGGGGLSPQNNDINYLLLETGFFLLQEDGSKIIL